MLIFLSNFYYTAERHSTQSRVLTSSPPRHTAPRANLNTSAPRSATLKNLHSSTSLANLSTSAPRTQTSNPQRGAYTSAPDLHSHAYINMQMQGIRSQMCEDTRMHTQWRI